MRITMQWETVEGKTAETTAISVEEPHDGALVANQLRDIAIDLWREAMPKPTAHEDSEHP